MRRLSPISVPPFVIVGIWFTAALSFGCTSENSKERRELRELEAAIGLVASAGPAERGARLEQLEKLTPKTERISGLKRLCASAYRSFERASTALARAKVETQQVEAEVARFKEKRAAGETLSAEEGQKLKASGARAAASIGKVTRELDLAEGYVAACEKRREALKTALLSE